MQKSFAITALVAVFAQQVEASKCYALALSSGDQNSMYQAGVLKSFANTYTAEEMAYSAVSGVSGGAINAVLLASFATGQEGAAADQMKKFWEDSANFKMYKSWLGREAEGLLWKGGLWNDEATLGFVTDQFANMTPNQRWVDVGLTDALKGTFVDFKSEDLTGDMLNNVMYGQFAAAGVFPPAEFNGTDYFDGSTIWDLDVFSVVNQCQTMGFADEDIVVDTILTSEKTLPVVDASGYHSLQMLWRYLSVSRYYSNMDGLLRAQFAYPKVNFRNVVAPSADMPSSWYPLNLNQSNVDEIYDLGVTDGTACATSTTCARDTTQFFAMKKGDRSAGDMSFEKFLEMKQNGEISAEYDLHADSKLKAFVGKSF